MISFSNITGYSLSRVLPERSVSYSHACQEGRGLNDQTPKSPSRSDRVSMGVSIVRLRS